MANKNEFTSAKAVGCRILPHLYLATESALNICTSAQIYLLSYEMPVFTYASVHI